MRREKEDFRKYTREVLLSVVEDLSVELASAERDAELAQKRVRPYQDKVRETSWHAHDVKEELHVAKLVLVEKLELDATAPKAGREVPA